VHDLLPITALGGREPRVETIGSLTIAETTDLALASVSARSGRETACAKALEKMLGAALPGPGKALLTSPMAAVWMGADQWMIGASQDSHEDLAAQVKAKVSSTASVTEQTDAWACFDVTGSDVVAMFERLCPAPVRRMMQADALRTTIHQMGCFVICGAPGGHMRVLGPRSSAGSLHHALMQAARSVA
jgi:sarcosine oxidase subunit gamma